VDIAKASCVINSGAQLVAAPNFRPAETPRGATPPPPPWVPGQPPLRAAPRRTAPHAEPPRPVSHFNKQAEPAAPRSAPLRPAPPTAAGGNRAAHAAILGSRFNPRAVRFGFACKRRRGPSRRDLPSRTLRG